MFVNILSPSNKNDATRMKSARVKHAQIPRPALGLYHTFKVVSQYIMLSHASHILVDLVSIYH